MFASTHGYTSVVETLLKYNAQVDLSNRVSGHSRICKVLNESVCVLVWVDSFDASVSKGSSVCGRIAAKA